MSIAKRKSHDYGSELRAAGLRATPARKAILKLLETVRTPLEVSIIFEKIKHEGVRTDPATVFRIMNTLTEKGVTTIVQLGDSTARYELSSRKHHHHLVCEACGKIEDMPGCPLADIEKDARKKKRFIVKKHALEFYGLCVGCAQ